MLDDRAGRHLELRHERARGVRSSRLLNESCLPPCWSTIDSRWRRAPASRVVGRALVRVLAVGQVGDLDELVEREPLGERLGVGEPVRDRGVVARRVRERLGGQLAARVESTARRRRLAQLVEHEAVALGVGDARPPSREVLGRGAHHRRAADVDVLDHLGLGRLRGGPPPGGTGTGCTTTRSIGSMPCSASDAMSSGLSRRARMRAVECRVQRLDPPAEHLGGAGQRPRPRSTEPARRGRRPCRWSRSARRRARAARARTSRGPFLSETEISARLTVTCVPPSRMSSSRLDPTARRSRDSLGQQPVLRPRGCDCAGPRGCHHT